MPSLEPASTTDLVPGSLLQAVPDAVVVTGADGLIRYANAQVVNLFGYEEDELLEQPIEVLIPERFRSTHVGHRAHYTADPRTRPMGADIDLYGRRKDGTEFPAEISLSSLEGDSGRLVMAAIRDVTDRKKLREQFERFFSLSIDMLCIADVDG